MTNAFVFTYNRLDLLRRCCETLITGSKYVPEVVTFIDDCSTDDAVIPFLKDFIEKNKTRTQLCLIAKERNEGFSHSARCALRIVNRYDMDFVWFVESDYIFRDGACDEIHSLMTETAIGRMALGIVGYDHPQFQHSHAREMVFPHGMLNQCGEYPIAHRAMYRPFKVDGWQYGSEVMFATNTCWTSFLNWRGIIAMAREFPLFWDLWDQAFSPRENPFYSDSGKYKSQRTVDDGMLSHAISWLWNHYAIKHGIDRSKYAGWLNIRPSVAAHSFQGGMHG